MAFLLESLKDLDEQLRLKGSRLFVTRGKPEQVLPGIFYEWGVTKLTFEADFEPRSLQRDAEVTHKFMLLNLYCLCILVLGDDHNEV